MICIYYDSCDRSEASYEQHFSVGSFPKNMLLQRFITDFCRLRSVFVDVKELGVLRPFNGTGIAVQDHMPKSVVPFFLCLFFVF